MAQGDGARGGFFGGLKGWAGGVALGGLAPILVAAAFLVPPIAGGWLGGLVLGSFLGGLGSVLGWGLGAISGVIFGIPLSLSLGSVGAGVGYANGRGKDNRQAEHNKAIVNAQYEQAVAMNQAVHDEKNQFSHAAKEDQRRAEQAVQQNAR